MYLRTLAIYTKIYKLTYFDIDVKTTRIFIPSCISDRVLHDGYANRVKSPRVVRAGNEERPDAGVVADRRVGPRDYGTPRVGRYKPVYVDRTCDARINVVNCGWELNFNSSVTLYRAVGSSDGSLGLIIRDRDLIIRDRDRDQDLTIRDRDYPFRDRDL